MIQLQIKALEIEGEIEQMLFANPYEDAWFNAYNRWYSALLERIENEFLLEYEAGKLTEAGYYEAVTSFKQHLCPRFIRGQGKNQLVSLHDNPHTRGHYEYRIELPAQIPTTPIEECHHYFGDSREGFTYGSTAMLANNDWMRTAIAIEEQIMDNLAIDEEKSVAQRERLGYFNRTRWHDNHGLADEVYMEIETPIYRVVVLNATTTTPVTTLGADWSGEFIDCQIAQTYLKPFIFPAQ